MNDQFKVGDFVRFLNDEGEGFIVSFSGNESALVEDSSGFAFEHPLRELVKIENSKHEFSQYNQVQPNTREMLDRNVDAHAVKSAAKDFKNRYKERAANDFPHNADLFEVDLHIHELLDNYERMSNGEIVTIQMEHFERMLAIAEKKKVKKVVFIHGVGQGVLRAEIRAFIKSYYPQCEFLDGNYQRYGHGATEVRFR
jgi:hypothetical protein